MALGKKQTRLVGKQNPASRGSQSPFLLWLNGLLGAVECPKDLRVHHKFDNTHMVGVPWEHSFWVPLGNLHSLTISFVAMDAILLDVSWAPLEHVPLGVRARRHKDQEIVLHQPFLAYVFEKVFFL